MSVSDVSVTAGALGEVIADAVLQFNKANVFFNLVTKRVAPPGSLNVTFPEYTKVTSSSVTADASGAEETDTEATSITSAKITLEVLRNVIRADITDLVKYGSATNVYGDAGNILGNAMAAKFDDDAVGLFSGFSNNVDNSDAAITLLNIFDAVSILQENSAPTVNGKYYGVFHPRQIWGTYGLINALDGVAFDKTNEFLNAGYVGSIAGVEIFTTPEIDSETGNDSDEATGLIFSPQAIACAYKEIRPDDANVMAAAGFMTIERQRDASKALTELVCNGYWELAELVDTYGVSITTQARA